MRRIKLKATSEDQTVEETVELEFTDDDLALVDHYLENIERLKEARILESGLPALTNIKWNEKSGLSFEFTEFDYRNVYELLHLARPLLLSREPASFEKVCALFGKKGKDTALATHLKSVRNLYERGDYQPYFQITFNDTPLFHDKTLKAWLNGIEYHQDEEKRKLIKNLEQSLSEDVAKGIFVSQLSGRLKGLFMVAYLAQLVSEQINA